MIPRDYITAWRGQAPWVQDIQVEQDLVICRALVHIFSEPVLSKALAFRGGTALYKLHLKPALRYSEDIDLVQVKAAPAGPIMDALHATLNSWLGQPTTKQNAGRVTFKYTFHSESAPAIPLRLKVEINTREHFTVFGYQSTPFSVSSPWFEGHCDILSYHIDELLATKMRALHQRKKGRDLFDLHAGIETKRVSAKRIVEALQAYMQHGQTPITRAVFEKTFSNKISSRDFIADIGPLLAPGYRWDLAEAAEKVRQELIALLPGDAWRGMGDSPNTNQG